MKTLTMALLLAGLTIAGVQAQSATDVEVVTISHVKKGEEPKQVLAAIKNDFPEAIVKDMAMLPRALYGKQWAISEQGKLSADDQVNFYQVQASWKDGNLSAVYDKDGKLVSYSEFVKQGELPATVKNTLSKQFSGYQIARNQERIHVKSGKEKIAYKVELVSGKEHKIVFLDQQGNVTRTTKPLHI